MNGENISLDQEFSSPGAEPKEVSVALPRDAADGAESAPPTAFLHLLPEALRESVAVIPAEWVTLHRVHLPVRSARQRQAALPFALEEEIAAPLHLTHVAQCQGGGEAVLAATLSREVMEAALEAGPGKRILPEQMLLPPPEAPEDGTAWLCHRAGERVLVRVSDGTGFAALAEALPTLWRLAGRPRVLAQGAALPAAIPFASVESTPPMDLSAQDLRQGAYRPPLGLARPARWLFGICLVALLSHLAILAADLRAQSRIADRLQQEAQAALARSLPGARADQPIALVQRQLAAERQPQSGSGFLPLLERLSVALAGQEEALQFRQLSWSAEGLRLSLEAPDLDALQRAEARLAAAGLRVESGTATADSGAARAELTVLP